LTEHPNRPSATDDDAAALDRCCDQHPDWTTLVEHLAKAFPELTVGHVVVEVTAARDAADMMRLGEEDVLGAVELVAWHRLLLLSGRAQDTARLDPETHVRVPQQRP
jgi:hypothetical protein